MSRLTVYSSGRSVVNLADRLTPGSADHSGELKKLWDRYKGTVTYYIPRFMTVNIPLQNYTQSLPPRLYSHMLIEGDGPDSQIQIIGSATNPNAAYAGIVHTHYDSPGTVEYVTFRNLAVMGDGPGNAQTYAPSQQSAAIRFAPDVSNPIKHTLFDNVLFMNHNGFPCHSDGVYDLYTKMLTPKFINCGQGANMNGSFFAADHAYFTNSEGFECSGLGLLITFPLFEDVFSVAISAGGDQGVNAFPGGRIIGARVYGVRGGTGLGSGIGIITAESAPDMAVIGCYVERTYSNGYQFSHSAGHGPDDGAIIQGNAAVNCGQPGSGGRVAFYVISSNLQLVANRAYNRVAVAGDQYDVTGFASTTMLLVQTADGTVINGGRYSAANGGLWAADFNGATNTRWTGLPALTAGTSGLVQLRSGATFASARDLRTGTTRNVTTSATANVMDSVIVATPSATGQTLTLFSAVGLAEKTLTITNTFPASRPYAIAPAGTETIDGVNAAKTLGSAYAAITLQSDGANWVIINQKGTVT